MSTFLSVYQDLFAYGQKVSPRGSEITELTDYQFTLAPYERFTSFVARGLPLEYMKQEFLWYLRADRFDHSIEQHANMWKKLRDHDDGFNSNYGQYLFSAYLRGGSDDKSADTGSQFTWVVEELTRDKHSRRAVMTLLDKYHLRRDNPDVVCTYSMSFRIRNSELQMSVNMRSNDAIFGMTNDCFCFSMIHEMVYVSLLGKYPDLKLGHYVHKVDSLHVYQRHYEMLEVLNQDGLRGYIKVDMPRAQHPWEFASLIWDVGQESALTRWFKTEQAL